MSKYILTSELTVSYKSCILCFSADEVHMINKMSFILVYMFTHMYH